VEIRESLGTYNWEKAQEIVREWEAEGQQVVNENNQPITIEQAKKDFLADADARKLKDRTVYKYRLMFRQLQAFADENGIRYLKQLDTSLLRKFRASWKDGGLTALKKLERIRCFFRFAQDNDWVRKNPAKKIANPQVSSPPTLPFSCDDMIRLLASATKNIEKAKPEAKNNALRLRALILLLRYSGLRIGDAVSLSVERLAQGKVRVCTQKTGTHVHCPLPDCVIDEILSVPKRSERFWFWTGNSKLQTTVADWQGRLHKLFVDAKIEHGHAHRFRDTFATELLLSGVPLERVSILLGHHSIKITERHYSPWIRERQEQAEADVRRSWARDPLALLETKGTHGVHGRCEAVN
jgi:site-specific recombinase XerD